MKTSYVLFVPGASAPTVRHDSIESAREEAKRLHTVAGVSTVMLCQVVEVTERVVGVRKAKKNPLPTKEERDETIF